MKIRVALSNEATETVESEFQIRIDVDHRSAVLELIDRNSVVIAAFGPGSWLSAIKVTDED